MQVQTDEAVKVELQQRLQSYMRRLKDQGIDVVNHKINGHGITLQFATLDDVFSESKYLKTHTL